MEDNYDKKFIEIERGLVEAYIKILLEYFPKVSKAGRDEVINGLEKIVKIIVENAPKKREV